MNTFLKHPTTLELARRLPAVLLIVWLICIAEIALADSPIVAKLNLNQNGSVMTGELRFDLSGGNVQGLADIAANSSSTSPVKRQSGSPTTGRFQAHIEFNGTYRGGPYNTMTGVAKLSGTFTDDANCVANLNGTGTFKGSVSAPLGLAEVTATWDRIEFQGCNLSTPQSFSALLPAFTFDKTDAIPLPVTPLIGGTQPPPSGPTPPIGLLPLPVSSPSDASTAALPFLLGGGVLCFVTGVLIAGLVLATRARPARSVVPPPIPLGRLPRPTDLPERGALATTPSARLVVARGRANVPSADLSRGVATIGRDPASTLTVNDAEVSRQHARVAFENGAWVISDLGSGNGTFVNSTRITRQTLRHGDQIQIGQTVIVFQGNAPTYAKPTDLPK